MKGPEPQSKTPETKKKGTKEQLKTAKKKLTLTKLDTIQKTTKNSENKERQQNHKKLLAYTPTLKRLMAKNENGEYIVSNKEVNKIKETLKKALGIPATFQIKIKPYKNGSALLPDADPSKKDKYIAAVISINGIPITTIGYNLNNPNDIEAVNDTEGTMKREQLGKDGLKEKLLKITKVLKDEEKVYAKSKLKYQADSIINTDNGETIVVTKAYGKSKAATKMHAGSLNLFNAYVIAPDGSTKQVTITKNSADRGGGNGLSGVIDNDGYKPAKVYINMTALTKKSASISYPNSIWQLRSNKKAGNTLAKQLNALGLKCRLQSWGRDRGLTGSLQIDSQNKTNIEKKIAKFAKDENTKLNGGKMIYGYTLTLKQNPNNPKLIDFEFQKAN